MKNWFDNNFVPVLLFLVWLFFFSLGIYKLVTDHRPF